jgi:hypothetical protein
MEEKEQASVLIRVSDPEALKMIRVLAEDDVRSMGNMVAWLIRQEHARRYGKPSPETQPQPESQPCQ